jgi:hypothetical protein
MRDYSNTGLISPTGLTIKGDNNIVQMHTRNEKKDRFEIQKEESQGEIQMPQQMDIPTRFSTIYEKPYTVPFSNVSPQISERSVGVKMGVEENIRPLSWYVNPLRNEPLKVDRIDEPTTMQEFTRSYDKTPLPDTVIPITPYPEPSGAFPFQADPNFPAQTQEEYKESELITQPSVSTISTEDGTKKEKDFSKGVRISQNRNNKGQVIKGAYILYDKKNRPLGKLDMRKKSDREIYERITGEPYRTGNSPSKGKSQII